MIQQDHQSPGLYLFNSVLLEGVESREKCFVDGQQMFGW
jgi:hypothetical protein